MRHDWQRAHDANPRLNEAITAANARRRQWYRGWRWEASRVTPVWKGENGRFIWRQLPALRATRVCWFFLIRRNVDTRVAIAHARLKNDDDGHLAANEHESSG